MVLEHDLLRGKISWILRSSTSVIFWTDMKHAHYCNLMFASPCLLYSQLSKLKVLWDWGALSLTPNLVAKNPHNPTVAHLAGRPKTHYLKGFLQVCWQRLVLLPWPKQPFARTTATAPLCCERLEVRRGKQMRRNGLANGSAIDAARIVCLWTSYPPLCFLLLSCGMGIEHSCAWPLKESLASFDKCACWQLSRWNANLQSFWLAMTSTACLWVT